MDELSRDRVYSFTNQRALIVENSQVNVWDFLCGTAVSWQVSPIENESCDFVSNLLSKSCLMHVVNMGHLVCRQC